MDSFLRLSPEDQRLYCEQAQTTFNLPPSTIEKDYWVCLTLRELFALPTWEGHLTFKGGTSLSKCWKLINRFSEDLDIVIDRGFLGFNEESFGSNQLKKLRRVCSERIMGELLPQLEAHFKNLLPAGGWSIGPATAEEDPDQQTIMFDYPGVLKGTMGYLNPRVRIELGARSDTEPNESPSIRPFLCEALPDKLGTGEFSVRTVAARRTLLEKAMLLHEETFRPPDKLRRPRMARHYYDLRCMIEKGIDIEALNDNGLFEKVAEHREAFFGYGWVDYGTVKRGSMRLIPTAEQLPAWQSDYEAMRDVMFFGEVPTFDEILRRVRDFEAKLNS